MKRISLSFLLISLLASVGSSYGAGHWGSYERSAREERGNIVRLAKKIIQLQRDKAAQDAIATSRQSTAVQRDDARKMVSDITEQLFITQNKLIAAGGSADIIIPQLESSAAAMQAEAARLTAEAVARQTEATAQTARHQIEQQEETARRREQAKVDMERAKAATVAAQQRREQARLAAEREMEVIRIRERTEQETKLRRQQDDAVARAAELADKRARQQIADTKRLEDEAAQRRHQEALEREQEGRETKKQVEAIAAQRKKEADIEIAQTSEQAALKRQQQEFAFQTKTEKERREWDLQTEARRKQEREHERKMMEDEREKQHEQARDLLRQAQKKELAVQAMQQEHDLDVMERAGELEKKLHKERLEKLKTEKGIEQEGRLKRLQETFERLKDPKYPALIAGGIGLSAALVLASHLGYVYLKRKIGAPKLVKETSMPGTLREWIFGKKEEEKLSIKDIVLAPDLFEKFRDFSNVIRNANIAKTGFPSAIFYGPPGTGKTFGAKIIAKYSGLPYVIIASSAFNQYKEGKDIYELDNIIRWARERGPAILFFDEADSGFPQRGTAGDEKTDFVNFMLGNIEEKYNKKLIIIYATNYPQNLDTALKQRTTFKYYFPLPGLTERITMIKMYFNKVFGLQNIPLTDDVVKNVETIAKATKGFAGREIKGMIQTMMTKMLLEGEDKLTWKIAEKVMTNSVEEWHTEQEMQRAREKQSTFFAPTAAAA